ncbi:TetR/AcrR family transcriptional regulator [Shouchella clausii]|uniref:TetR/AcrR family transcriptional regulator n=1 Tax=Shouchella TaxID=2893057 RepID=UPI0004E748F4|nr:MULTISPECIES: TetR/AcrR family transcriptional regulator [Shouchella]ALA53840.1 Transcriptional regulator, TetR family [Shouchella clausii]MBU3229594.1 TetR/AcrR family transcriptional regulator [Shouchella clausii]MBU3265183.1 TetR/AcrR family transcriptional regulator [Shouchella clausii]MBU3506495.1 TetR/AcrR family transcriptional regulator [Shouchella clausii]MBU3533642.1 TetR/AcrR family transcriptional regulator [Shouchella clausii]
MAEPNVITKQDLIESAKTCIVENGVNQLTLKAVAEGAGVTQGTVYYHFKTKEQLMIEVVEDMCKTSWERLEQMKEDTGQQGIEWMKAGLEAAYERNSSDSSYHSLFFSLVAAGLHNHNIRERIGGLLSYENDVLQKQIQALAGDECSGMPPDVCSVFVNALIDGLAVQSLMRSDFDSKKVFDYLERLLAKQLGSR